jgi:hypothetical protein
VFSDGAVFSFEELKRDSEVILLRDASRRFRIELPIEGGMSKLSPDDGANWQNLYTVWKDLIAPELPTAPR